MRRVFVAFVGVLLALLLAVPSEARRASRNYLAGSFSLYVLTGDVSGDVIDARSNGGGELGVGHQLNDHWLLEFSYGFQGAYEQAGNYYPLPGPPLPPDSEATFRVSVNPILFRARWTHSGNRDEYIKPELSLGLGWLQVSRLLRNYAFVPPFDTSQMLASIEFGASALFVFNRKYMGYVGGRYTLTERRGIADATDHLDSVGLVIGFRTFLPSPRDVAEPD